MKNHKEALSSTYELDWLIRLRWLALSCQIALLLIATLWIKLHISLAAIGLVIITLTLSNLILSYCDKKNFKPSKIQIASVLVLDTLLLTFFLYFSGGPFNPFSVFYLVQIALAAVVLTANWAWFLVVLSSLSFALLFKFHQPLMKHSHGTTQNDISLELHLYGMLLAFIFSAVLMAYFLTRLTSRLRKNELELRNSQKRILTSQRLASLATLSAGAAHKLASPLSTIAIASSDLELELKRSSSNNKETLKDLALIKSEIKRCKQILEQMSTKSGQLQGELAKTIPLSKLIKKIKSETRQSDNHRLKVNVISELENITVPLAGLKQSLIALIENALDASENNDNVFLEINSDDSNLHFEVKDQGNGINPQIIENLGEPFLSTKAPGKGMGLGIFLVKAFADTWNGKLQIVSNSDSGTRVMLSIPRFGNKNVQKYR